MTTQITKLHYNEHLARLRDRTDYLMSNTFPTRPFPKNALLRFVAHRPYSYAGDCTEEAILQEVVNIARDGDISLWCTDLAATARLYADKLTVTLRIEAEVLDSIKGIRRLYKDFAIFTQKNFGLSGMEVLESYFTQSTGNPITPVLDLVAIAELMNKIAHSSHLCLLDAIEQASKQANETRGIL